MFLNYNQQKSNIRDVENKIMTYVIKSQPRYYLQKNVMYNIFGKTKIYVILFHYTLPYNFIADKVCIIRNHLRESTTLPNTIQVQYLGLTTTRRLHQFESIGKNQRPTCTRQLPCHETAELTSIFFIALLLLFQLILCYTDKKLKSN